MRNIRTQQDTTVTQIRRNSGYKMVRAPGRDILAWQVDTLLNDIDLTPHATHGVRNVSLGIDDFAFLPGGDGFLVSSSAHLLPDRWTSSKRYTVPIAPHHAAPNNAKLFYTLPKEVGAAGSTVMSIGTSTCKGSPDRKWIAFIVHPTAGVSADSNILCVLSADVKQLIPIAEMLDRDDGFEWAPGTAKLAFIAGGGRSRTEGKRLSVPSPPFRSISSTTPNGFSDHAFTWNDDSSLTVSSARDGEERPGQPLRSLPSLYTVQLRDNQTRKITDPPPG